MPNKLKFPVLKNIEYFDLSVSKDKVFTVEGKEIEGLTWRKFQYYLGEHVPEGSFKYSLKQNGRPEIHIGQIRVLKKDPGTEVVAVHNDSNVLKELNSLASKVELLSKGNGVSVDTLIEVTKQSYLQRIEYLGVEIQRKEFENERLIIKVDKLEAELVETDDTIEDLKGQTGVTQYISIVKEFLSMKAGLVKPITNLADSDSKDIPPDIIEILGVVDWQKVPVDVLAEITNTMKIFIQKLPMKGS